MNDNLYSLVSAGLYFFLNFLTILLLVIMECIDRRNK